MRGDVCGRQGWKDEKQEDDERDAEWNVFIEKKKKKGKEKKVSQETTKPVLAMINQGENKYFILGLPLLSKS